MEGRRSYVNERKGELIIVISVLSVGKKMS